MVERHGQLQIKAASGLNYHPIYRSDIDGLRAVAILLVVLNHAIPSLAVGGFIGVDIFFVISGFLISSIMFRSLSGGVFSYSDFYSKRIRRIFPALILVLLSAFGLGWFVLLPDEFDQLGKHMVASMLFLQNLILTLENGYFDTETSLKPLMHLWSLAIEEQFYAMYPVLIVVLWRLRVNIPAAIGGMVLFSFLINVGRIEHHPVTTFFLPHSRIWELLAGGLLAYWMLFSKRRTPDDADVRGTGMMVNGMGVTGFALIAITMVSIDGTTRFPGWWALPPVLGTCLLIAAGPESWINRRILGNPLMVFVGMVSYPLYLWHWPLLSFARIIEQQTPSLPIRLGAVALSFVLAWLTFRLVESPLRFGGHRGWKTAGLAFAAMIMGCLGYVTHHFDGWAFRNPRAAYAAQQFKFDYAMDRANCTRFFNVAGDGFCSLAKPEPPTVVIVGDSHSNSLYPGLIEAYRDTSENVMNLGVGGCPPFFDTMFSKKGAQDRCTAGVNAALTYIEGQKSIKTVILAARGPLYVLERGFDESEVEPVAWEIRNTGPAQLRGEPGEIFSAALRRTVDRLLSHGKQVAFMLDIPEMGFPTRQCTDIRPFRFSPISLRTPCAIPRSTVDERNRTYREITLSVLSDFPQVRILDGTKYLCDTEYCYATKDGELLYRDDNHLSVQGSRYVASKLAQDISR